MATKFILAANKCDAMLNADAQAMELSQSRFLTLAKAIAKHNALVKSRYPSTDPTYKSIESFFS